MKNSIVVTMLIAFLIAGCAFPKYASQFNAKTIKTGMTNREIVESFGRPYKEAFKEEDGILVEDWYYKEAIYIPGGSIYELNSVLHLKDGKLISYEMGDEKRVTENSIIAGKEDGRE